LGEFIGGRDARRAGADDGDTHAAPLRRSKRGYLPEFIEGNLKLGSKFVDQSARNLAYVSVKSNFSGPEKPADCAECIESGNFSLQSAPWGAIKDSGMAFQAPR